MIQIRPVDAQDEEVWRSLLELRERYREGWTLIGARMVTLYAIERNRTPPRFSLDADALINVRLIPRGTQQFSKLLLELGYVLTLVPDPKELVAMIRASEKGWLRAHPELNDPDRVWWRAQQEHRDWGIYVLRTLMG